jgi:hypothetical protein
MANVTIIDTGYISLIPSGTPLSGEKIANSGTALELLGVSFTYDISAGLDPTASPSNTDYAIVNSVSYENSKVSISGIVRRGALAGTNTTVGDLEKLQQFIKTKGVKCIYYNDSETGTNGFPLITKFMGVTDGHPSHPTQKHFHVRFSSFTVTQDAGNSYYNFRLEGYLTS